MKVYTAIEPTNIHDYACSDREGPNHVFLGGSIEMGKAVDWQQHVIRRLSDLDVVLYNPRRGHIAQSWANDGSSVELADQIEWELDHLQFSDIAFFYIDPDTKSPVSLMEIGFAIGMTQSVMVCCPRGFYRYHNLQALCERMDVPFYEDLDVALDDLREQLSC